MAILKFAFLNCADSETTDLKTALKEVVGEDAVVLVNQETWFDEHHKNPYLEIVGYKGMTKEGKHEVLLELHLTQLLRDLSIPEEELPFGETPNGEKGDAHAKRRLAISPKTTKAFNAVDLWIDDAGNSFDEEGRLIFKEEEAEALGKKAYPFPLRIDLDYKWICVTVDTEPTRNKKGRLVYKLTEVLANMEELTLFHGPRASSEITHYKFSLKDQSKLKS